MTNDSQKDNFNLTSTPGQMMPAPLTGRETEEEYAEYVKAYIAAWPEEHLRQITADIEPIDLLLPGLPVGSVGCLVTDSIEANIAWSIAAAMSMTHEKANASLLQLPFCKHGTVALFSGVGGEEELQHRFSGLCQFMAQEDAEQVASQLVVASFYGRKNHDISDANFIEELAEYIPADGSVKLIIFDRLQTFSYQADIWKSSGVRQAFQQLRAIAKRFNATVLVVHNENDVQAAQDRFSGLPDWLGELRSMTEEETDAVALPQRLRHTIKRFSKTESKWDYDIPSPCSWLRVHDDYHLLALEVSTRKTGHA